MTSRLVRIFLVFLPMAAIGTLVHELGHMAVARARGYSPVLHYGWMTWGRGSLRDEVLISAGGPVTNMLIGTIGFAWLFWLRRGVPRESPLVVSGWCATLLALFWSRQVFNAAGSVALVIIGKGGTASGDETFLTLGVPSIAGLVVCGAVVWFHPRAQRLAFAIAAPAGCVVGFVAWYGLLGPHLLP